MIALVLLVLLIVLGGWLWLASQPPNQRRPALVKMLLVVGGVVLLYLSLSGRVYLALAILAGVLPFLRRLLMALLARGPTQANPGNQSRVATDILEMSLDHDTGEMTGQVLQGPLAGRSLAHLSEGEFIELLQYCRQHDYDSARLLESYLDRRFADSWRADDPGAAGADSESASTGHQPLTEAEALDILGLKPGASREEIIQAHRQMMQKMHPDHGGSAYLAALINEARAVLLD
ncbi:hypothetical protein [Pseudomonas jilinensis]|uniref:hypothetical protein n=1 Tax=Pseudomonas jilinensis TaxID=2078689 RepID=UPI00197DBA9D